MAERRPGRPKSHATAANTVDILNGEVPPRNNPTPSPKKRKREDANERSLATKRRASEKLAAEGPKLRKSTRLSHPRASTEQHRSGDAGHKQSQDPYEVPSPTTPPPSKTTKAMERAGKAKPVLDDNSAVEAEVGEEDATNSLMTSPASNTRNIAKRIGRVKDSENPIVEVQPVKRGQRPQRLLTKRTKTRSNALLKPRPAPPQGTKNSSVQRNDQEEPHTLPAAEAPAENRGDEDNNSSTGVLRENQEQTPTSDEPVDSVENQSAGDGPGEVARPSGTRQAFERASSLYDCKECWDGMLEAAREHDDKRGQIRASEIQELIDLVKAIKLVYRAVRQADGANPKILESEIEEYIDAITKRIRTIKATKVKKKDARIIKDIYVQAIPKMVLLLKTVLVTRSLDGELSIASLEELIELIDATIKLCTKAFDWPLRPKKLEPNVRTNTEAVIKTSLEALREAYSKAQVGLIHEEDEEVWKAKEARKAEKRQALAEHVANFQAQEDERKRRAEIHQRERNRHTVNGVNLLADGFDIDDLGLNDGSLATARNGMRRSLPWRETGVAAARRLLPSNVSARPPSRDVPRMLRERTEEIPGPMAQEWNEEEELALLAGLERFTDANRYLEIDAVYGCAGGPLSSRDVDELMQRARHYKQTMASHIEEEREKVGNVDGWAFLLSVEG
jgi:hypothetical protein